MNQYLVFEIRIWLLLILIVLGLAAIVGAALLIRMWLTRRERDLVEQTEQRARIESLEKRNRMLIRLDHELKNPLTALRTSAATVRELMRDDQPHPDEIAPVVKQIDTSARRVARLLADLRKLADVESRTIDFRRVDMDRLIHQAVEDARTAPGAEDRMIVATVARAPWKLPDVAGEEDLLLSAILNLIGNAIKYSSDTDTVELRANEQVISGHRWVVVEVADTGSGIPVDEQSSVWDELQRGSKVRSVAGSGMGLSLVRSIISRHGGSVELFSQEGVGTSVRLVLPVLGDAQPAGRAEHAAAGSKPVTPFQDKGGSRPQQQLVPPRQPNSEESRFMGTPRRTSKRRIQTIDGQLHDTATGERFGPPTDGNSRFRPPPTGPQDVPAAPQGRPGHQGPPSGPVGSGPAPSAAPIGSPRPAGSPHPAGPGPRPPHGGMPAYGEPASAGTGAGMPTAPMQPSHRPQQPAPESPEPRTRRDARAAHQPQGSGPQPPAGPQPPQHDGGEPR